MEMHNIPSDVAGGYEYEGHHDQQINHQEEKVSEEVFIYSNPIIRTYPEQDNKKVLDLRRISQEVGGSEDSDDYFKEIADDEHEHDYQDREKDYNPIQMIQIHPAEELQTHEPMPAYTGV